MRWRLYGIEEFEHLGPTWDSINSGNANLPILDSQFFQLLLEEFGDGDERLAVCEDSTGPVAAAILTRSRFGAWRTFQASQAPLGAWVQKREAPVQPLLESLQGSLAGLRPMVSLTQMDPDIVARPLGSGKIGTLDYIDTARIEVRGSFDDYWATRGKNLRGNMRRQRNRLTREGIECLFECVADAERCRALVDDYGELESRGWKGEESTAVHASNSQGRFYRGLLSMYCDRGEGLIFRYSYNGELVASDLCLARDGVFILLKTTYDEKQTTTSPSYLLRQESLRWLFNKRSFTRVEFYGRVMEWHKRWTTDLRRLYHVNCFRWRLIERIFSLKRSLVRS